MFFLRWNMKENIFKNVFFFAHTLEVNSSVDLDIDFRYVGKNS